MMQRLRVIREILAHPANRAHRLAALVRYVKWQVGRRLVDGADFAIRITPSVQVILSKRENYATMAYLCGLYDFDEMQFLAHYLRPGDVFGDFGANVGVYSVLAGATGATVLSVEPVPATFARLQGNLRLNSVKGLAVPCGLSDSSGTLRFTVAHGGMNHVATPADAETVAVDVCSCDELVARTGLSPRVLKIDVEGFELPLLRGGAGLLSSVAAIIIELNGSGRAYGHTDDEVHALLLQAGFGCFDYCPESRELRARSGYQRRRINSLYIHHAKLDEVGARLRTARDAGDALA